MSRGLFDDGETGTAVGSEECVTYFSFSLVSAAISSLGCRQLGAKDGLKSTLVLCSPWSNGPLTGVVLQLDGVFSPICSFLERWLTGSTPSGGVIVGHLAGVCSK